MQDGCNHGRQPKAPKGEGWRTGPKKNTKMLDEKIFFYYIGEKNEKKKRLWYGRGRQKKKYYVAEEKLTSS
jgi:hypothetical protein